MRLWLPVFITLVLILPEFFYGIDFCNDTMLVFIGKYPLKYIRLLSVLEFYFLLFFSCWKLSDSLFLAGNNLGRENFSGQTGWRWLPNEKLKLLLHLEEFMDGSRKKCSEELLPTILWFYLCHYSWRYGLIGGFGVLILYLFLFRFL
jgi:hypothetical protein